MEKAKLTCQISTDTLGKMNDHIFKFHRTPSGSTYGEQNSFVERAILTQIKLEEPAEKAALKKAKEHAALQSTT